MTNYSLLPEAFTPCGQNHMCRFKREDGEGNDKVQWVSALLILRPQKRRLWGVMRTRILSTWTFTLWILVFPPELGAAVLLPMGSGTPTLESLLKLIISTWPKNSTIRICRSGSWSLHFHLQENLCKLAWVLRSYSHKNPTGPKQPPMEAKILNSI